jgi:threonine dehydratase
MIDSREILLSDLKKAQQSIYELAERTPLVESVRLSKEIGVSALLKLETAQQTGSFKVRGAANKLLNMTPEEKKRGVVAVSTGNHGRAVSFAAGKLGIPCQVFLSKNVPENKVQAIRDLGAGLTVTGNSYDEAFKAACDVVEEEGRILVPPFDDPYVISGQGTIGLEILEARPDIGTVIVPLSGGGLIAGIALALKEANPDIKVIGVSMESGAAMYESLKRGRPVEVEELDTLADSLKGGIGLDNRCTFSMTQKYVDDLILVTEAEIEEALRYAFFNLRFVLEGGAAVGIAALLAGKISSLPEPAAVVLSGRNVDMKTFQEVVTKC